jgi:hypothetical protein
MLWFPSFHGMKSYNFLRLIYNKVTLWSYGYFLKFSFQKIDFWEIDFSNYVKNYKVW